MIMSHASIREKSVSSYTHTIIYVEAKYSELVMQVLLVFDNHK